MKYRHSFHAGNFADVHKHVTLLALVGALQRRTKDSSTSTRMPAAAATICPVRPPKRRAAIGRLAQAQVHAAEELRAYAEQRSRRCARSCSQPHLYPGSPLLALASLRPQDRAVLIELDGGEAHALEAAVSARTQGGSPARPGARGARRRLPAPQGVAAAARAARPHLHRPALRGSRRSFARVTRRSRRACGAFRPGCSAGLVPDQGRAHQRALAGAVRAHARRAALGG